MNADDFLSSLSNFWKATLTAGLSFFVGFAIILHISRFPISKSILISDVFLALFFWAIPVLAHKFLFKQEDSYLWMGALLTLISSVIFLGGEIKMFLISLKNYLGL